MLHLKTAIIGELRYALVIGYEPTPQPAPVVGVIRALDQWDQLHAIGPESLDFEIKVGDLLVIELTPASETEAWWKPIRVARENWTLGTLEKPPVECDGITWPRYLPPVGKPSYWMHEKGSLREAVYYFMQARLGNDERLPPKVVNLLRGYFAHWVNAPVWELADPAAAIDEETLAELQKIREDVTKLQGMAEICAFLNRCEELGVDPL